MNNKIIKKLKEDTSTSSYIIYREKYIKNIKIDLIYHEATDGKFILPTEAYRGEGLSYYFAEPQDYIKIKNTDKLAEFFKERKLPYVQGRVWTTDSMLRETVNLVRKRKEEGCIAVEMELAGVQAISDFYGF